MAALLGGPEWLIETMMALGDDRLTATDVMLAACEKAGCVPIVSFPGGTAMDEEEGPVAAVQALRRTPRLPLIRIRGLR